MSSTSHGLPKKSVLICPSEERIPGTRSWMSRCQSLTLRRGVAVPVTPSDKDREAHEFTHLSRSTCRGPRSGSHASAVSFLKELGYTRFRCRTDREPAIKAMVDAVIKCLSDDRAVEQNLPEENSRESCESGCAGGLAQSLARTNSSVATRRIRSIWVNRRCYSSVRAVAYETRHLAVEQISAQTEWCDRVRLFHLWS